MRKSTLSILQEYPKLRIADIACGLIPTFPKDCGLNIESFDNRMDKEFKEEYAKDFDILFAERPCSAEELVLRCAIKYNKIVLIVPCGCRYGDRSAIYYPMKGEKIRKIIEKTHNVLGFRTNTKLDSRWIYLAVLGIPKSSPQI